MTREWEQAIRCGDTDALRRLHRAGADVNSRDRFGHTGVMVAATHGLRETVSWLVSHGADLDHTAKYHLSALMLAVINGHAETARALVEAGADVSIRGSGAPGFEGKTALDLARRQDRDDLVAVVSAARGEGSARQ